MYLVGIFHCSLNRRFSNQHHLSFYNLIACSLEYKYKHMNPVIAFSVYDLLVTIAHGLRYYRWKFVGRCDLIGTSNCGALLRAEIELGHGFIYLRNMYITS